jgi:hypothetical protein
MKAEVRLASPTDVAKASEFIHNTPNNLLDPGIVDYPSLRVLAVDVNEDPKVFAPIHPVLVVESLAHSPGITPRENAYALRKLQDALEATAKVYGISEIWWMCADPTLIELAARHGYEEVKTKVLRKKVTPNV